MSSEVPKDSTDRESDSAQLAAYWDTLRRSLTDRANAFAIYMAQLASANGRGDDGFSRALEMCQIYGEVLRDQVEYDWKHSHSRARYTSIKSHLSAFITTERWIDRRFARGSQGAVPRALKTIAREQLEAHGLTHHEPVLTVGPPDSFETHQPSLYDHLFKDLHLASERDDLERHRHLTLSIISMPYIEGTTTLWYPITLGHEIAHLRIDATKGNSDRQELMSAILDPATEPELMELIKPGAKQWPIGKSPSEILTSWVDELLCDLNAVRLFGPAGLSAIAEFVGVLAPAQSSMEFPTATHPPLSLRIQAMKRFLGRDAEQVLPRYVRVWERPVPGDADPLSHGKGGIDHEVAQVMREVFSKGSQIDRLIEHVCSWHLPYRPASNPIAVAWVRDALLDGMPAGTHYEDSSRSWHELTIADVVNGAWAARDAFEPSGNGQEDQLANRGLLADLEDRDMPEHEKRRRVDILASKAIDSVELARLWGGEGSDDCRIISPDSEHLDAFLSATGSMCPNGDGAAHSGVLAAAPLVQRMRLPSTDESERLVVTPLFANSIHQAGIDVRLGPEFIVFKHASSAVFDPLTEHRDPRVLQERVHMGWGEKFFLHPGELILAATLEYVILPRDVAAQVVTRSSYGRLGLTTATAVQVQPSSRGCITLELVNHGNTPIALSPGARVGQLMLFPVRDAQQPSYGRYWFPVGPEFSKVGADADAPHLIRLGEEAGRVGGKGNIDFCFRGQENDVERFEAATQRLILTKRGGRKLDAISLVGDASPDDLAKALRGYLSGVDGRGLVVKRTIESDRPADIVITVGNGPEADVTLQTPQGEEIERLGPEASASDLADALARLRARRVTRDPLPM